MIAAWFLANRTHAIYLGVILVIGLLTNALFGRYKVERAEHLRWEKAYAEHKADVKVVTRIQRVEVPVEVAGQVVYKNVYLEDTETVDKSTESTGTEVKAADVEKKVSGQIPVFTAGVGPKISDQLDALGFLNARLYGPVGAFAVVNSENQFKDYSAWLGVSYSR